MASIGLSKSFPVHAPITPANNKLSSVAFVNVWLPVVAVANFQNTAARWSSAAVVQSAAPWYSCVHVPSGGLIILFRALFIIQAIRISPTEHVGCATAIEGSVILSLNAPAFT